MKHREQLRPLSFDEQRALEDLQKLHRDIQRARGDREQAEAEFDSFVKSFRAPQPAPVAPPREPRPVPAPPPVSRETRPEPPPAPVIPPLPSDEPRTPTAGRRAPSDERPVTIDAPRALSAPSLERLPPSSEPRAPSDDHRAASPEPRAPGDDRLAPGADVAPPFMPVMPGIPTAVDTASASAARPRRISPALAVIVGSVVVAAIVFAFSGGGSEPEVVRDVPGGAAAEPAAPQPEAAAEAVQPPSAAPETGVNLELITKRTVWVRVTVDGRRAIERELPGGERIPLRAEQSIVIRAGDAGAVSVRRGSGRETPFGEEGFPATRTFTAERRGAASPER